jgi:hypothetical protein
VSLSIALFDGTRLFHRSMSGNRPAYGNRFKQLANRINRDARVAIHVWYFVQISLNRAKVIVILQLDATVKFQVIQRAGHATIRQAGERLEFNRGTLRPSNCSRDANILKNVSERACEMQAELRARSQWKQDREICAFV